MVVEKTVEYDDVIGKLREEVDKLKNSKHPRFGNIQNIINMN